MPLTLQQSRHSRMWESSARPQFSRFCTFPGFWPRDGVTVTTEWELFTIYIQTKLSSAEERNDSIQDILSVIVWIRPACRKNMGVKFAKLQCTNSPCFKAQVVSSSQYEAPASPISKIPKIGETAIRGMRELTAGWFYREYVPNIFLFKLLNSLDSNWVSTSFLHLGSNPPHFHLLTAGSNTAMDESAQRLLAYTTQIGLPTENLHESC